ncbi:DoxX family protein [Mycobacterium sp. 1274761.0]|uniref:DoxX family protein n=1 Tax=Mycobacterium sp. 1274761.0 TaxID=1834077 RepID=UPI0007FCBC9D|nr:DoxX family protein [Mycobacterium sp. 1274761.0]OBK73838.1 DoxX family protein [Mycobacterium sp. 1274761.0]
MATTDTTSVPASASPVDVGLLILRIGVGAAVLQAGLIKVFDFGTTTGFMESGGWRLPTLAALMVTAAETAGALGLILGILTPLAGCAVAGAMICAWAVNVSQQAFWSQPFNAPYLLFIGAASLMFAGAGAYSVDARVFGRARWSPKIAVGLLILAFAVAIFTWLLLNGTNPLHLSSAA